MHDRFWNRYSAIFAVIVVFAAWLMLRSHHYAMLEGFAISLGIIAVGIMWISVPIVDATAGDLAPLIAIVGCDGSGKSTLAGDVVNVLGSSNKIATCYLGLGSGEMGERIKRWPVIGKMVEAKLASKAAQARTKGEKIPGVITALVIFGFSIARQRRFRKMLLLRRRGVTVVTDRYPQIEVAGFYDGPGLSAARAGGPIVAWLARHERDMYADMADHRPDLVIRLNVDVETAHRRKPEHKLSSLQAKVAVTPTLRFNGAPIVDLDSREPYEKVRRLVLEDVQQVLDRREWRAFSAA